MSVIPQHLIERATEAHADAIWQNLRPMDFYEVTAVTPEPVQLALRRAVRESSESWAWLVDGKPVALFGVAPLSIVSRSGSPWLVATPALRQHRRFFLEHSRWYLEHMQKEYALLWNMVSINNHESIRWLKWLGFRMNDPERTGRYNQMFMRFAIDGSPTCAIRH